MNRIFLLGILILYNADAMITSLHNLHNQAENTNNTNNISTQQQIIHSIDTDRWEERIWTYTINTSPKVRIAHIPARSIFIVQGQTMQNIFLKEFDHLPCGDKTHGLPDIVWWCDNEIVITQKLASFFKADVVVNYRKFTHF